MPTNTQPRWTWLASLCALIALLSTSLVHAEETPKPPPRSKARQTPPADGQQPATRRIKPPSVRSPFAPKPDKRKKPSLWGKMTNGMGKMVPKSVKKSWKKAQRKWKQTIAVYDAMSKLVGESPQERKERLARERRETLDEMWQNKDSGIEKMIRKRHQTMMWKRACLAGSASSCIRWSKDKPSLEKPLRMLRDIWTRRLEWKKVLPVCKALQNSPNIELDDEQCYADALAALNQTKPAEEVYRKSTQRHPKHGLPWLSLGQFYLRQKRHKDAELTCGQAATLMPKDPYAWHCLAQALEARDKKAALQEYYKACKLEHGPACSAVLKLRPGGWSGLVWWSSTLARISRQNISQGTLYQSCRIGILSACQSLADQYRRKGLQMLRYKRWSQARWWLQRAVQTDKQGPANWRELGLYYYQQKLWSEACPALQRTLTLNHKQPKLWRKLGECHKHIAKSSIDQARNAYKRACALGQHEACKQIQFQ